MSRSAAESYIPVRGTVADYSRFEHPVLLLCSACGKKKKYKVGRIIVDPRELRGREDQSSAMEEAVSFSGLFRCRHCRSPGPWKFPDATRLQFLAALLVAQGKPENSGIHFARLQLFDGTHLQTGGMAEDYLRQKLEESPDDAFLWCRLGNLYDNAGEIEKARPAYERAVQIDPGEIQANYTLGCYRMDGGDLLGAAECFQTIARHARTAPRHDPELLEEIVHDSLRRLYDLHCESEGEIPFAPKFPMPSLPPEVDGPPTIHQFDVDLTSDEGWDTLSSICLTGELPEPVRTRELSRTGLDGEIAAGNRLQPRRLSESNELDDPEPGPVTVRGSQRVARNDPCPCGSGKKYKRCCGRS